MTEAATPQSEKSLPKTYEFAELEQRWLERWLSECSHAARMEPGKPAFSIVIPPPNVTGVLHIGHALNSTLQDILTRYHRMQGKNVLWLPGTDHAGIATQNVVERQLEAQEGLHRNDLGREAFIERVWEWRREKGGAIIKQLKRLGASCDWRRERFTMDEGLSRAVREVFVRLYHDGLIYKGDYIVNWCPRCQTALSDDEVKHEDSQDFLYQLRYPLADGSGSVVVATTRPETMLGDTAVAVHPEDERYLHLHGEMALLPLSGRSIPIIVDRHVQREFGTGALKVTPAHDRDDYEIGLRHELPRLRVMDERGIMTEEAGVYAGLDRFACRERIVNDLQAGGFLHGREPYQKGVGGCYRCSTVIEPTLSKQWFVAMRPLAEKATAAVRDGRTVLHPASWNKTFYHWMDSIRDWCISRQIWWGHRIPAWSCDNCGQFTVTIEDPTNCVHCGATALQQESDVLDTWFSSGLWPFSTLGWPEQTKELAMFYPTSVLITSFDILFFWVARMMMLGLHVMNEVPFRDVYLHALVRDKEGKKMSKSVGNVIDPLSMIAQYGADALRFTLTAFAAQGREIRMDEERIEGYRRFINKLWNAARFTLMHLEDGGGLCAQELETPAKLGLAHRWILSRCDATLRQARNALDGYNFNEAASASYQFIWHEFCDWYLEWIKADLFSKEESKVRQAKMVLLAVMERILKIMHPITPFVTEEIWSKLPGERGLIMLADFPKAMPNWPDAEAEGIMELLMGVISGLRNIRAEADLHPSAFIEASIFCPNDEKRQLLERYSSHVAAMSRAKNLHIAASGAIPEDAGQALFQDIELVAPLAGLMNVAAELEKLDKEQLKLQKERAKISVKLANEQFIAKAPPEVVAKEHEKLAELDNQLTKTQASIQRLRKAS